MCCRKTGWSSPPPPAALAMVGGCVALPPHHWQMPNALDGRTALSYLRAFGLRLPRASHIRLALEKMHPVETHYYVRWVGVRPALQGEGLGSALMQPTPRAL
jgi:GNAT superfamily N-acetyltransferase